MNKNGHYCQIDEISKNPDADVLPTFLIPKFAN